MKKLIKEFDDFSLWEICDKQSLLQVSRLTIYVNYKHHLHQVHYPQEELQKLYIEDLKALPASHFYIILNNQDEIVGTIKSQKWDNCSELSIEKDFMVDLKYFFRNLSYSPREIYHVGRFVIDQEKIRKNKVLRQKRITILKLLMYYALLPVYNGDSNILFCECDEKLFSKLNLMGIYPKIIGCPKVYLGSKTLPIYCDKASIHEFISQNKHFDYV